MRLQAAGESRMRRSGRMPARQASRVICRSICVGNGCHSSTAMMPREKISTLAPHVGRFCRISVWVPHIQQMFGEVPSDFVFKTKIKHFEKKL